MTTAGRLPNLVIAGVGKSGTTSLFHHLGQHPDICPSDVKETEHFSPLRFPSGVLPPLDSYRRHFRHCAGERWVLEATPTYCYGGQRVIDAMQSVLDEPRVLMVLREPAERLADSFRFMRSKGQVPASVPFGAFLDRCVELRAQGLDVLPEHRYHRVFSVGWFTDYLPAWFDAFGADLRIVFFDQLRSDPHGLLADLFAWLGLDPGDAAAIDTSPRHATIAPRSGAMRALATSVDRVAGRVLVRAPAARDRLVAAYSRLNRGGAPVEVPDADLARARRLYEPMLAELRALLAVRGVAGVPAWVDGRAVTPS